MDMEPPAGARVQRGRAHKVPQCVYIDVARAAAVRRQLCVEYDADDSAAQHAEAQKMLKDLSEACDDASTKRAMTRMDADGDGTVRLAEFERYLPWDRQACATQVHAPEAGVASTGR